MLRLTRRQVQAFYLLPRDEWGNLRDQAAPPPPADGDAPDPLLTLARKRGWPDWLAARWCAEIRRQRDGQGA